MIAQCIYNPVLNTLRKIEKLKLDKTKITLISVFGYFLSASVKNLFLQGTRTNTVSPCSFDIILIFPYFLISSVLRPSETREVTHIYRVSYTRYQVPFYFW